MLLEYQMEGILEKKINKSSHTQPVKVQEGSSKSLFLKVKKTLQNHQKKMHCLINKINSLPQNPWMMLGKNILSILYLPALKHKTKHTNQSKIKNKQASVIQ